MSQTLTDILVVIAAVFLVWLVIRLFRKPIRWILKLLLNTAIGFAALFLLNFFGSAIGITLGLNWINALVIGVTGFPGLVLLLLIFFNYSVFNNKLLCCFGWNESIPKSLLQRRNSDKILKVICSVIHISLLFYKDM